MTISLASLLDVIYPHYLKIPYLWICPLNTPKSILWTITYMQNGKDWSCPTCSFPAEVKHGDALPSCFSFHIVNKCTFSPLVTCFFCAFALFCILLVKCSLSIVLKSYILYLSTEGKKKNVPYGEKYMC